MEAGRWVLLVGVSGRRSQQFYKSQDSLLLGKSQGAATLFLSWTLLVLED